jgi:uncharacterized protein YjbI with pentapeptide repeats
LGEGTEDTRRRVVMSNLVTAKLSLEAIERVVRRLADEKLVVTDDREKRKVSGDAIVDVAHEALIRGWKLLRGWLDEDRQNLRQQRWIEDRAIEWQKSGKAKEFLLSGKQLRDVLRFNQQQIDRFSSSELVQQLLKVSKLQRRKGWASVAIVYMLIPIVLGGFATRWWYLETKWAVLRRCEREQTVDGKCAGRLEALRGLIDANVNLQAINLSSANLSSADFSKTDLSRANLSRADLSRSDLREANLSNANLKGVDLSRANLVGANLSRTDMSGANLNSSNLSSADLSRANLTGASFIEASLFKADFFSSDLTKTNFNNAYLIESILVGTDLRRADFSNAILIKVSLGRANLDGVNLGGASLEGIDKSDLEIIKTTCSWEKAKISEELRESLKKIPDPKEKIDCSQWNK